MAEIKRPSADIFNFKKKKKFFLDGDEEIESVQRDLISVANRLLKIKDKTAWPSWTEDRAKSMLELSANLTNEPNDPPES